MSQILDAQRRLKGNLDEGIAVTESVTALLATKDQLPQLGTDAVRLSIIYISIWCSLLLSSSSLLSPSLPPSQASMGWKQTKIDDSRQKVSSALSAMLASTASIITLTGGDPTETNYTAVGAAVTTM